MGNPASRWFVRLWAVAVLAHIIGNPRPGQLWPDATWLGVVNLALGIAALVLLWLPGDRRALVAVALLTIASVWFEAPFVGNHWLLAGFVSVAILVSLLRADPWAWFAPTGRWMLLAFYSWAAFNKLNAGFFDPEVSCGVVYANQWLGSYGLPLLPTSSVLAWLSILGTAVIELSVPALLLIRRTRSWGIVLGSGFHFVISLDLDQHFYDFTAVLLALFFLFAVDGAVEKLDGRVVVPIRVRWLLSGIIAVFLVAGVAPLSPVTFELLTKGVFALWVPFGLWIVWLAVRVPREDVAGLRLKGAASYAVVGIVVLNGFLPYLEVKTATSWNMYANLVTAAGESNHLVIRRTLPLTEHQENVVEILESDDSGLSLYATEGWLLPERNVRDYLADHPGATVTLRALGGQERTVLGSEFAEPLPWWAAKFQLFRALDMNDPPRCQLYWLPAR